MFWVREVMIIVGFIRVIMIRWIECCINNSCIGSIIVIIFRISFIRVFVGFILEGIIFIFDWLWCFNFVEVICCIEEFFWCGCVLFIRVVIISSVFFCWCKIFCISIVVFGGIIFIICKFCVFYCVRECFLGVRYWNFCFWWIIVINWIIKLIWYSWIIIVVVIFSIVFFGFS